MSTNDRYMSIVWEAVLAFDVAAIEDGTTYWFTSADIAKRAGVSLPTVRKYVADMVRQEIVHRAGTKRFPIFALVKGL